MDHYYFRSKQRPTTSTIPSNKPSAKYSVLEYLLAICKTLSNISIMGKSEFMGGSLSFKGDKKKAKKKMKKSKRKIDDRKGKESKLRDGVFEEEEDMTEAEKKAQKFKLERQRQESEKIAQKSHRERVEELNEKLGSLTELNDIPRVSAAGNG